MNARMVVFLVGTALLAYASRAYLARPRTYGFFRFWAFTCLLGLVMLNLEAWFYRPASPTQLLSWILLAGSAALAVQGFLLLRKRGRPSGSIEATTLLVSSGVYRRIRHPLYASLLYFAWGVVLKHPSAQSALLGAAVSVFLYLTARAEEQDSRVKFGAEYEAYTAQTKMFIPFLL
jgi:protein-S-isoprenylcysteine O-methyltransferase Ste14